MLIMNLRSLKLSILSALTSNVSRELRGICTKFENNTASIYFYYDGEMSENKKEISELVMDEVIADCSEREIEFFYPIIRIDYPDRLPLIGSWVFLRAESDLSKAVFPNEKIKREMARGDILLSIGDSLLGNVSPSLRAITVKVAKEVLDQKRVNINFYYDGEISEIDKNLANNAISQIKQDFLGFEPRFEIQILRLDYPSKVPVNENEDIYIYHRAEV